MTDHQYLREQLLSEHSKANTLQIIQWVGKDPKRFDALVHLFLHDEYRVIQRAGWPLGYCAEQNPALLQNHFGRLIKHMKDENQHPAVRRNITRMLACVTIPRKFHGEVMTECFGYIEDADEKIAVQASAVTILENLLQTYPEIAGELKLVLQERMQHATVGFKSRAGKLLKKI